MLNARWQNRKERPIRSTNNGYIAKKAKCDAMSEEVCDIYLIQREAELLINSDCLHDFTASGLRLIFFIPNRNNLTG